MNDDKTHDRRSAESRTRNLWASFRTELPLHSVGTGFSLATDQYRKLALRVEEAAATRSTGQGGFVVAVTSPDAGAGKTTTSLNLALSAARRGERRVLVVESDLWKPEYETMLTMSGTPVGLSEILLSDKHVPLDQCVVSVWSTGLDVLVAGAGSRNGDLATTQRMANLVEEARSIYDIVVLDSPPFALASGKYLASLADGALIVVRIKATRKRDIEGILSMIGREKTLGLVLNDVRNLTRQYKGYSAYGAYGAYAAATRSEPAHPTRPGGPRTFDGRRR